MGFHTDQSLDLHPDSYICLFSCYETDDPNEYRKLKVQNKTTKENSEFVLDQNSVIIWSAKVNKEHVHKIILDSQKAKGRWLGITLRFSKTLIDFESGVPKIVGTDKVLRIATEAEKKEFFKCKGQENSSTNYQYPDIEYTISPSDLMPVG